MAHRLYYKAFKLFYLTWFQYGAIEHVSSALGVELGVIHVLGKSSTDGRTFKFYQE